jgi:hypothetical protein
VSPLVAGTLIDAQWRPTQLYLGCGLVFAAAAAVVLLHRLMPVGHPEIDVNLKPSAAH